MDKEARKVIAAIHNALAGNEKMKAYRLFNDIDDDDVYAIVKKTFPGMVNWDANGNYVGGR